MVIDIPGGIPPPHTIDIKAEKNSERIDTRAIEESGKSGDLKLNVDSENIAKKRVREDAPKNDDIEIKTYNAKGDLTTKKISKDNTANQLEAIHLVV